jgi:hypothetical protein
MKIIKDIILTLGLIVGGTALLIIGAGLLTMFVLALASPIILIVYLILQTL